MQTAAYHQNRVLPRDLWFRGTALADVRKGERNHVLGYGRMPLKVSRSCGTHSVLHGDAYYRFNAEIHSAASGRNQSPRTGSTASSAAPLSRIVIGILVLILAVVIVVLRRCPVASTSRRRGQPEHLPVREDDDNRQGHGTTATTTERTGSDRAG